MSDVMKKISILSFFAVILISVVACSDEDNGALQNDLIKRTMSPLIVGEKINFAYAAGTSDSKLSMMCVEASVPVVKVLTLSLTHGILKMVSINLKLWLRIVGRKGVLQVLKS